MDKRDIIKKLQKYKYTSEHYHNIKEIGVFGSYAKGDNTSKSDMMCLLFLRSRECLIW
jgi:Nucleotidyltransferase domain.